MMPFLYLQRGFFALLEKERGYNFMGESKGSTNEGQSKSHQDTEKKERWYEKISRKTLVLITAICSTVGLTVLGLAISNFYILPNDIKYISGSIAELKSSFNSFSTEMRAEVKEIREINTDLKVAFGVLEKTANQNTGTVSFTPTDEVSQVISYTLNAPDLPGKAQEVQFLSNTVVAYNEKSGDFFEAHEIANHPVLLPYKSGDQEVVFYGQINENGCWDGNCIINTYKDNKLELITDAVYLNGKLLSCKQVFYYAMSSGKIVWAYADRLSEESFSTGETWLYEKESDFYKEFELDDVTKEQILTADSFREKICAKKIAYYYGNTSDGYFNDSTGNAYMIHYFDDGSVKLLYSGNFADGLCNDSTGNAWYIVREKNTNYMCYKGPFKDNKEYHTKRVKAFKSPLSSLSSGQANEFWRCWNDSRVLVYLGNSLSREDIDSVIGNRHFEGDGKLDWGYLDHPLT